MAPEGAATAVIGERIWRGAARRIRRGYQPLPMQPLSPRWWLPRGDGEGLRQVPSGELAKHLVEGRGGLAFVAPTALRRSRDRLPTLVEGLLEQVRQARRRSGTPILLVVGLQWFDGEEEEALGLLGDALGALGGSAGVLGLTLRGPGKVETLRTCLPLVQALSLRGMGWVDDDVRLEPSCLAHLVDGFLRRREGPCVVGATKVPHRRAARASRVLFRIKERIEPATNYPHGCCILIEASLFDHGIPERYCCDDGYFCYEMLRRCPGSLEGRLALIPEAVCHYRVGAPRGRLLVRLRRLLLNSAIFLADYPQPVGSRYLGEFLYPGFWPLSRVSLDERSGARDPLRWTLQAFHLICLGSVALELAVRGLLGRPLREIRWSATTPPKAGTA